MIDDHLQIIRSAKYGDKEAFTRLIGLYKDFVYRIALGMMHDFGEAEDLTQETFVKAFLSLKTIQDERAFPSWIATIVTRLALDAVKKRKRHFPLVSYPITDKDVLPSTAPSADLRLTMQEMLSDLTPEHRAVILLREVQGFDYQEIADILHIPIGTVRSRIHAARTHLRQAIQRD